MNLADLVRRAAAAHPDAIAVRCAEARATYGEIDELADRIGGALRERGVGPGDRVALWLAKSPHAVAAMQGVLRAGAAYVPIDPLSPPLRARMILEDCSVRALVVDDERRPARGEAPDIVTLTPADFASVPAANAPVVRRAPNDLAYILYTSGSTGRPKGVCISHENALAFVTWAASLLEATSADVFANHAALHFDLSVLDLYVAFHAGACVTLIPDAASYVPEALVEFVREERPSIWYSVPSALMLMMEHGGLAEIDELPMRVVCYAGEPWPVEQLRRFRARFGSVRLFNLYGPTETNVCTFHEVRGIVGDRPVPIGTAASGDRVWAVKDDGTTAAPGEQGELWVEGPTVMLGYWGQEPQGDRPYRTGDIVRVLDDGSFEFVGRRDAMVKLRGYRIEPGEIEAALAAHPAVREVAVALDPGPPAELLAFVVPRGEAPGLLELKAHVGARLPRYMVIDRVRLVNELPRTRNGKIDRLALVGSLGARA